MPEPRFPDRLLAGRQGADGSARLRIGVDTHERPPAVRTLDTKLRIGVDFDGVLFDQVPHIIERFRSLHGVDISPVESWAWNLSEHPAIQAAELTDDEVWEVFTHLETDAAIHRTGLLDPHAIDVLHAAQTTGHEVHIVTSRKPRSREITRGFLEAREVPFDQLNMGVYPKTGWDVLIDDLPPNVEHAAEDGSLALLMDQPYNRGFETDGNPYRVNGWQHIERVLERLL